MKRQDIYKLLEDKMLGYTDYVGVPVQSSEEKLAPITVTPILTTRQIDVNMYKYTGTQIYVRETVARRLKQAARLLKAYDNCLKLEVVYGYRPLEIQEQLFEKYKAELVSQYEGDELLAAVHRLVAVLVVAGHPAGSAVDIQILKNSMPLDFGTEVWEFVPDSYTFSPFISREAWDNRQLLRRVMMSAGFAPFDGEWWHFSYGDKEWAKYYGRQAAIYEQEEFRSSFLGSNLP